MQVFSAAVREVRSQWVACALIGGFLSVIGVARAALSPAAAVTWIVDDDGGPGVDFTDIQPALNAAVDGDLVLIYAGSYGSFVLSESLTLIAEEGAAADVGQVRDVAGEASISDLAFTDLIVEDCAGTVVLDGMLGSEPLPKAHPLVQIRNSADVRVLELDGASFSDRPAVLVDASSHVELVGCELEGQQGIDSVTQGGYAGDGEAGIRVTGGARVYVARTQARGGEGGKQAFLLSGYGGTGGDGLWVEDGEVLVTGRGKELIQGGRGGGVVFYGYAGNGGAGGRVGATSTLRRSNVTLKGGKGGKDLNGGGSKGPALSNQPGSKLLVQTPPSPALERTGPAPAVGGVAQVKLRSNPGAFSRLFVGTVPIVQPTPGVYVDNLVVKQVTYALGSVPSTGVLTASIPMDPTWSPGTRVYAQAMSIFPGGQIRRTNSVVFVVR